MKVFYGEYDTKPVSFGSDSYSYEQDFGFLREDGLLVISVKATTTDGASVGRIAALFVGSPLKKYNKIWAAPHDSLYRKQAVILNTKCVDDIENAFVHWMDLPADYFEHQTQFNKKFADQTLLQAMRACGEKGIKRRIVYFAVRLFGRGWWSKKSDSRHSKYLNSVVTKI